MHKKYLVELDLILDKIQDGPHFLKDSAIIDIMANELKKHDETLYDLVAYSIMSNHVHLVINT